MSSNDSSDNSGYWWIAIFSVLAGLAFLFDRTIWPELESPVLRCLLAPLAGVVLMFFYSGVWLIWLWQVIWNFLRWLTSPALVLLLSLLLVVGGGLAVLFHWASPPLLPAWAIVGGFSLGTLGGFIALRFASVVPQNPWYVKALVAFPVAGGSAYWMTNKLLAITEPVLYWTAITITAILLARILWAEESVPRPVQPTSTYQPASLRATDLPDDLRQQLLIKVREQIGAAQYSQLVGSMGEEGLIDLVLKQMGKSS